MRHIELRKEITRKIDKAQGCLTYARVLIKEGRIKEIDQAREEIREAVEILEGRKA